MGLKELNTNLNYFYQALQNNLNSTTQPNWCLGLSRWVGFSAYLYNAIMGLACFSVMIAVTTCNNKIEMQQKTREE